MLQYVVSELSGGREVSDKAAGLQKTNKVEVVWLTHLFFGTWKSGFPKLFQLYGNDTPQPFHERL